MVTTDADRDHTMREIAVGNTERAYHNIEQAAPIRTASYVAADFSSSFSSRFTAAFIRLVFSGDADYETAFEPSGE